MSIDEAREFEASPSCELAVRVRRYDDMGKVVGMQTPSIETYRDLMAKFLLAERVGGSPTSSDGAGAVQVK